MNTATLVRQLDDWETDSALYRLDPPLLHSGEVVTRVIVSTVPKVNGNHGSLAFAANADGTVRSWLPIVRSDEDDHASALAELGYQLVTP